MTEKEGLDAVEFLNKALPAGVSVKFNEENAKITGVDACLIAGAGALKNASNTLTCAVNHVNKWSGANCDIPAANRTQWYPIVLKAW